MTKHDADADIKKPSKSEQALEKLEAALDLMEKATNERPKTAATDGPSEDLAKLRDHNAALKKTNKAVSARLDGAIDQLRTILEN